MSLYSPGILISNATFSQDASTEDESNFLLFSANLFCPAVNAKNYSGFTDIPFSFLKNYLNKFSACPKEAEIFHEITFSKYIFYAGNIIVRFQQTDIIFPFHYFW
jgi:hypothetical protein